MLNFTKGQKEFVEWVLDYLEESIRQNPEDYNFTINDLPQKIKGTSQAAAGQGRAAHNAVQKMKQLTKPASKSTWLIDFKIGNPRDAFQTLYSDDSTMAEFDSHHRAALFARSAIAHYDERGTWSRFRIRPYEGREGQREFVTTTHPPYLLTTHADELVLPVSTAGTVKRRITNVWQRNGITAYGFRLISDRPAALKWYREEDILALNPKWQPYKPANTCNHCSNLTDSSIHCDVCGVLMEGLDYEDEPLTQDDLDYLQETHGISPDELVEGVKPPNSQASDESCQSDEIETVQLFQEVVQRLISGKTVPATPSFFNIPSLALQMAHYYQDDANRLDTFEPEDLTNTTRAQAMVALCQKLLSDAGIGNDDDPLNHRVQRLIRLYQQQQKLLREATSQRSLQDCATYNVNDRVEVRASVVDDSPKRIGTIVHIDIWNPDAEDCYVVNIDDSLYYAAFRDIKGFANFSPLTPEYREYWEKRINAAASRAELQIIARDLMNSVDANPDVWWDEIEGCKNKTEIKIVLEDLLACL